MDVFLRSPGLFDALAALVAAEWLVLVAWRRRTGRGVPIPDLTAFLGAGAFLFLALRSVAAGSAPALVGAPLVGALACHGWMIWRMGRW